MVAFLRRDKQKCGVGTHSKLEERPVLLSIKTKPDSSQVSGEGHEGRLGPVWQASGNLCGPGTFGR